MLGKKGRSYIKEVKDKGDKREKLYKGERKGKERGKPRKTALGKKGRKNAI